MVVGSLFICSLNSFAVYFETIEANKDFYLYNVSAKKYVQNNNGQLVMVTGLSDASTWQFSGISGSVSVKNGSHYILADGAEGSSYGLKYPGASATGKVELSTSSANMTIGGDANGYTFSVSKYYLLSGNYTYYFAYNGSKLLTNQSNTSTQSKWQLVSKRQLDNTITLSASTLALEAIQGGDPASMQFYINYDGNPTSISLTDGTNTLTISAPAAKQHPILVSYQVDDAGKQTFTLTDGNNAANKATFSFAAGSSATLGLTLSTTAASGNAIEQDKKTMTITGKVVTLKPQSIDWAQDFSALSLTTAPIPLTAVAKTTNGVATGKTITYTLSSTGVVKIVSNVLYVLAEGTTTITAKVAKDATYVGAEKSLTIRVSGVPTAAATITSTNASATGIYTGTIGGPNASYAFHRAKRQVDLKKCFDNAGQALFDTLYIFGVTTNTDGVLVSYTGTDGVAYTNVPKINTPSASVVCNATTPCYVYAKNGDNAYVHARTFDATQTRYDWDTKQNGKHIYFTGYCPFAYMGVTPTEEGWMYFKGGDANVDIYLDSCQIMGRYKTQTGKNAGYEQYILKLYASVSTLGGEKPNISFMSGASAPFVFTSTTKNDGQSYKPHIHIAGDNHLKGQVSSYITQTLGIVDMVLTTLEMDAGISKVTTYSSPIVVKPTEIGQYTDLELTDVWKDNTITNGYLKLNSAAASGSGTSAEKVVSVDLGSAYGSLTINGGQYHLRNSAADGTYTCNLAVGYRLFSKMVEKAGQKVLLHLYGFGGDRADSKVIINSGTFTMYKNMYGKPGQELGQDAYKDDVNFLDLRLPNGNGTSLINGGTFNGISNVVFCDRVISKGRSPRNAQDYWLCLQDVEITNTNADGSAQFTIPSPFSEAYDDEKKLSYSLVSDKDAISAALLYGAQSANAYEKEGASVVTLLLPGDACEEGACTNCKYQQDTLIFQWATAFPKLDAEKEISGNVESVNVGGNITVEVSPEGEELVHATNQLLYLDLEGMEDYSFTLPENGTGLSINDDSKSKPRGRIDNENDYIVERNLNFLKVVQADTWYTFTAPFNVHQISVLETKSEKNIAKMERAAAIEKQAQENFEMLYEINDFIVPNEEGRATSITFEVAAKSNGKATINDLVHYDGKNLATANYYLYKLKSNSEFEAKEENGLLQIEWEPVTAQSGQILMEKGKTYAIQFPWCPMCNDLYVDDPTKKRTYYDYWSNKYILFYGKGPQTLDGTKKHSAIVNKQAGSGYATFSGNTTFSDATISANGGYIHNQSTDCYELRNSSYPLRPGEGFLSYNASSEKMPSRISRSGQMIYDESVSTDVDGVPTIQDHSSLMLFDAMDGFELLSLHDQMVVVYNMQGYVLYQQYMTAGEQVHIAAAPGIYVVKGEKEALKLVVD